MTLAVRRLFGLLIAFSLLIGQGLSASAAICQHRDARAHALARQSHDSRIASRALTEDAAASLVAKKGAPSAGGEGAFLAMADLPPETSFLLRERAKDARTFPLTVMAQLVGRSVNPLLRPPLA